VIYYISPQVWAWKKSRVYKIRKTVDKMLVILPFEKEFYSGYDFPVSFCGHPLLDVTTLPSGYRDREEFMAKYKLDDRPIVALLPGSRKQEISRMLPLMAQMAPLFPAYQLIVAAAPSQEMKYYEELLSGVDLPVIAGETHEILRHARAALVTSGTATLETALFEVPEVVCYKGNLISYLIARQLVDVKYISLVNLIMDREVIKELIQEEFNAKNLERELSRILDPAISELIKNDYRQLIEKLGAAGASGRAASEILDFLK